MDIFVVIKDPPPPVYRHALPESRDSLENIFTTVWEQTVKSYETAWTGYQIGHKLGNYL